MVLRVRLAAARVRHVVERETATVVCVPATDHVMARVVAVTVRAAHVLLRVAATDCSTFHVDGVP
jgi:hypothetical protein